MNGLQSFARIPTILYFFNFREWHITITTDFTQQFVYLIFPPKPVSAPFKIESRAKKNSAFPVNPVETSRELHS
jgi:hypothetical protein